MRNTKKNGGKYKNKTTKVKPMNCSPLVKGKTAVKNSCFTDDVLYRMKKSYNKHSPAPKPYRGQGKL